MGGNGSTTRKVTFGQDEDDKVTVIQGVKLSEDVLQRMRDSQTPPSSAATGSHTPPPPPPSPQAPTLSAAEIQNEIRKRFDQEQALVREQLAKLEEKKQDREAAVATKIPDQQGGDELTPSVLMERYKAHEDLEKGKILAKQLERKERELTTISAFYKEQLELLEKKNLDDYKQTVEHYNQAATEAEAHIQPRRTASVCTVLQAQVLQCYRDNPRQTLLCSSLANQYMTCIQQAKKNMMINHG